MCGKFGHLVIRCWYRFYHSLIGFTSQPHSKVINRSQARSAEFYLPPEVQQNFSYVSHQQQLQQTQQAQEVFYQHTSPATHPHLYMPKNGHDHALVVNRNVSNINASNIHVSSSASSEVEGTNVVWFPDLGASHYLTNLSMNVPNATPYTR